jgi:hypothetical protein
MAKRNMPARWGNSLLGYVKTDFPQLARVPFPPFLCRRTYAYGFSLIAYCVLVDRSGACAGGCWWMVGWEPTFVCLVFLRVFFR